MKEHASRIARSLATLAPALLGLAMAQTPAAPPAPAAAATPAADPAPAAATPTTIATTHIDAFPPAIVLEGPLDRQRLVVRGLDADGATSDLTDEATYTIADPTRATWNNGAVRPLADGETTITITSRGQTTTLPITIKGAGTPVGDESFRLDVMPALTKGGCNSGACHGSARGQDGFPLSLFGFDPASDYRSITRGQPGRRINLAHPAQSLLLQKAIGGVSHTGGQKFKTDDEKYQTLLRWLSQGARDDAGPVPAVTAIELFPNTIVLRNGQTQRVVVRARYADGTDRDVTTLATLFSSNDYAAKIGDDDVIRSFNPGESEILARFGPLTVGIGSIVVNPAAAVRAAGPKEPSFIDACIEDKLLRMRIAPSELCTDQEFLRRATLDLTGLLPTTAEYTAFMASTESDKRAKLIDALMSRKEFTEIWVMKWAERLGIRSNQEVSSKATLLYAQWLEQKLAAGTPIDVVIRELVGATGGTFDMPATNFYQLERDTLKLSENVAQAFMGTRLQCAQCHNHPFDRWTMDDYYGLTAFFSQIARKQGEDPRETIVYNAGSGDMKHPVGGAAVPPRFLGTSGPADLKGRDRRVALADWLTGADNQMFARNIANFVWAHFFHRGIVNPVDDVRVSNPPSNEELLSQLAAKLVEYRYDMRPFVRDICNSKAYQRSTIANATNTKDDRNFSRAQVRRIRAEFLQDALSQVTTTRDKFDGLPVGSRAVQIADGTTSNYFLTTFGRATRQTVCTCEVVMEPSLSQALHLINGENVHEKIKQGGRIGAELAAGRTPEQVLDGLYVSALSRLPSDAERTVMLEPITKGSAAQPVLEDAFWALLNSREFIFNH